MEGIIPGVIKILETDCHTDRMLFAFGALTFTPF
jgi:hypothetical protein